MIVSKSLQGDIYFIADISEVEDPGEDEWVVLSGGSGEMLQECPDFWRDLRKQKRIVTNDG